MRVDTVLFDLDETLIAFRYSTEELLARTYDEVGLEPIFTASEYRASFDEFLDESTDTDDVRERCFRSLAEGAGCDPAIGSEMASVFSGYRDPASVVLLDGAEEVLEALAPDHGIGIVTNGPPDTQRPKIEATGIDQWADATVFAGFDTPSKPDPAPFEKALADLDGAAETAVVVGNSLTSDIGGAREAGITSVWIPAHDEALDGHEPDYQLGGLRELLPPVWEE